MAGLLDTWKNRLIDVSGRNPLMNFRFTTAQGKPKTSFLALPDLDDAHLSLLLAGKALKLNDKLRTHLDLPQKDEPEVEDSSSEGLHLETQTVIASTMPSPAPEAEPVTNDVVQADAETQADPSAANDRPVQSDDLTDTAADLDPWQSHLDHLKAHQGEWNLKQRNRVLLNLRQRDRSAEQEMGLNVLFLSYGFLKWRPKAGDEFTYSPLFLLPMDLDKQGTVDPQYSLLLDEDETVVFNPTLRLFLEQSFGLDLSAIADKYEEETPALGELQQQVERFGHLLTDHPDWEVIVPRSVLAIFHFANLILYNEMERWGEQMEQHPLIARFCDHQTFKQADFKSAHEIDRIGQAADNYQVIDADGSQREAIQAAKDGISFVLDGPPGTGKSQTIVNILAELVAQGKKVLFVSQKKAALDVVYYRMAQAGLDQLCLDLHDHRQSNKAFIHDLAKTWELLEESKGQDLDSGLFKRIQSLTAQLNDYADQINSRPGALALSLHTIYAHCANLQADLHFQLPAPLQIDDHRLQEISSTLRRLERQEAIYLQAQTHPWRELKRHQPFSQAAAERFTSAWSELKQGLASLEILALRWQALTGLDLWSHHAQWQALAKWTARFCECPRPPQGWLQTDSQTLLTEVKTRREQAEALQTRLQTQQEFLQALNPRQIELFLDQITRFEKAGIMKLVSPAWYAFKKQIAAEIYLPGQAQSDLTRLRSDLESSQSLENQRSEWLQAEHSFGDRFAGWETDWDALVQAIKQLAELQQEKPLNAELTQLLGATEPLQTLQAEIETAWERVLAQVKVLAPDWLIDASADIASLNQQAITQSAALPELNAWIAYADVRHELQQLGLLSFLEAVIQEQLPATELETAFLNRFYHLYLDAAEQSYPALRSFAEADQVQRLEEFRQADQQQFALNRQRVWQAHRQHYLQQRHSIPEQQASSLRKLAAQKRPRKRIRWLLKHLRELILQVHPCWMMSPLSVSQFIELEADQPTTLFDTVIFDEASQIYPEDGLCSIFRGKQLIVAGDPLQMPPTSVGRAFLEPDDQSDEDDLGADYESVLDLASTILRRRRLMWHYRSRYEELINPSNTHIYAGDLITFPRADRPLEAPVRFHHVAEGCFEKRKNRQEAEALVARLTQIFKYHQAEEIPLSIGIIAMGLGQQECIREVIQEQQIKDPDLEAFFDEDGQGEALFIKNLENVQGDERDIILLSVGYGKNKEGKFYQRFGPINQTVGHRRLNVAFTRARQQVEVFCSFHYHEIKVRPNSSAGVRFLRDYLRFAETGHLETSTSQDSESQSVSPITETVTQALLERGYQVHNQLGSSRYRMEIAVVDPRDPHRYALGIETDGPMYALADTARDRDRLRQQVLTQGGWNLTRIWSRAWSQDSAAQIEQLVKMIEAASLDYAEAVERRQAELEAFKKELEVLLHSRLLLVWEGHQYAVYKGQLQIHPPMMDAFDENLFGENLFRFRDRRKVGLMNIDAEILLPADYDYIANESLENGFYLLERNGKSGLMDSHGQVLIEPQFDSLEADFSEPFALVELEGRYGFVNNETGEISQAPTYDWVSEWGAEGAELGLGSERFRLHANGEIEGLKQAEPSP